MKKVLIFILLFGIKAAFAYNLGLELFHSKPSAFIHFLNSGFDQPFTSGAMKALIHKSRIKGFTAGKNKARFEILKTYLSKGYNFDAPAGRPKGVWGADVFLALAATHDMKSFESKLSSILPYEGISAYFQLKAFLYDDFEKKVWNPTKDFQNSELKKLLAKIKSSDFKKKLARVKQFYNSSYPSELSLKVALVPINDEGIKDKNTVAHNLRDIQIVPYRKSSGAVDNLEVIFHEFCHAMYEGQSTTVQKEIEDFYLNSTHPHSYFTYTFLNEALATAIGNGWYGISIDQGNIDRQWYSNKHINGLAKALFPEIRKYLESGRRFDRDFMKHTLEIAKTTFPTANRDVETNLMSVKVLSNQKGLESNFVTESLRKLFRVSSIRRSFPIESDDWINLNKNQLFTTMLFSNDKTEVLEKLKTHLNPDFKNQISKKSKFLALIPKNGRYLFWFNGLTENEIPSALKLLKSKKILGDKEEIISTF